MIREHTIATSGTHTTREQLWEALAELAKLSPDWRFGQLVCNIADYAGEGAKPPTVWDATDEELLAAARELVQHRRRAQEADSSSVAKREA
jgi:hypothetical protein